MTNPAVSTMPRWHWPCPCPGTHDRVNDWRPSAAWRRGCSSSVRAAPHPLRRTPQGLTGPSPNLQPTFSSIKTEIFADHGSRRADIVRHLSHEPGRNPAGGLNLAGDPYAALVNVAEPRAAGRGARSPGDPDIELSDSQARRPRHQRPAHAADRAAVLDRPGRSPSFAAGSSSAPPTIDLISIMTNPQTHRHGRCAPARGSPPRPRSRNRPPIRPAASAAAAPTSADDQPDSRSRGQSLAARLHADRAADDAADAAVRELVPGHAPVHAPARSGRFRRSACPTASASTAARRSGSSTASAS